MHEFKVIGGPYQTRVNYYFDSNGEYFHDHENNDKINCCYDGYLSLNPGEYSVKNIGSLVRKA